MAEYLKEWRDKKLGHDDQFLLFVEEGTSHRGDLEQVLKRDKIPIPQSVPKSLPAVQAADMLAWEANDRLTFPQQRPRANRERLFSRSRSSCYGGILSEADMRQMCCGQYEVRRDFPTSAKTIRFASDAKHPKKALEFLARSSPRRPPCARAI
jgi:hypothetical protein